MPRSDIIEKTVHETHDWAKDVEYELGWEGMKHGPRSLQDALPPDFTR
jgi:hypothetical protein